MQTKTGVLALALILFGCGGSSSNTGGFGNNNNGSGGTSTLSLRFTPLTRGVPESQVNQVKVETFRGNPLDPLAEVVTTDTQRVGYARSLDLTIPSDSVGARITLGDFRGGQFVPVLTGLVDFRVQPGQTVVFQDPPLDPNPIPLNQATPLIFTNEAGTTLTNLSLAPGASQQLQVRGGTGGAFDLTDQVNYTVPSVLLADPSVPGLFRPRAWAPAS